MSNPILLIEEKAAEYSGISLAEAHQIDRVNLNLVNDLGEVAFIQLCRTFFDKVYLQLDFQEMFSKVDKEEMIQNMYEFLIERLGGPTYYSERKGLPMLHQMHKRLVFTSDECYLWLALMRESLKEHHETFSQENSEILMNYFKFTAESILKYHTEAQKIFDDHISESIS
jgi:truncated hemoglobin YjbI